MLITDRIKQVRKDKKLSTTKLAILINMPVRTIIGYERGERKISADFIKALFTHLNINPIWLLTGKGSQFMTNQEESEEEINTVRVNLKKGQRLIVNYED